MYVCGLSRNDTVRFELSLVIVALASVSLCQLFVVVSVHQGNRAVTEASQTELKLRTLD